jgi:hypothetical protein
MSNDLTQPESAGVPDWARKASTGAKIGNIDAGDLKPPRLKILAGMSPEITEGTPGATVGHFWMTILNRSLGPSVTGSLVILRKSYHVWPPRGGSVANVDQKGPLATATDGVHWDQPNQKWEVRLQGNPTVYTWKIGKLVTDFRADKFGSSQDDDPRSKPIATLTYDSLWLIDLGNGKKQLAVFTASRTGVQPTTNFISTAMMMGVDHFYQRYRIVSKKLTGPTGDPYFSFEYQHIGNIQNEQEGAAMRALYEQYSKSGFIVDLAEEAEKIQENKTAGKTWTPEARADDGDDIPFLYVRYRDEDMRRLWKNQRRGRLLRASENEGWSPGDL